MHNFSSLARSLEYKGVSTKRKAIMFFIMPVVFSLLLALVVLLYQFRIGNKADQKHTIFYLILNLFKFETFNEFKNFWAAMGTEQKLYVILLPILGALSSFSDFIIKIVVMVSVSGLNDINKKISSIPILSLDTQSLAKSASSNLSAANILMGLGFIFPLLTFIGVILALVGSSKTKSVGQDILWNLQVNQLAQNANNSNGVYY